MTAWRLAVWVGAGLLMAPLLVMAWFIPYFIGVALCGWAAYHASDFVRLRNKELDRALLAFDLADLLELGVPLSEAVARMAQEYREDWRMRSTPLARDWEVVAQQVGSGSTLGQAVSRSKRFPAGWGAALAYSERAEQMPAVLRRLGQLETLQMEQRRDHLVMPAMCGVMLIGVLFFLVTYIWPTFFTLFEGAEVPAPWPMAWLSWSVKLLRNPATLVPLIVVVVGLGLALSRRRWSSGPRVLAEQSRLAEALACGAELGLSVPQLLELASRAAGPYYRSRLQELSQQSGDSLSQALGRAELLPAPWVWFIGQAEARGELADGLHRAARHLLEEQQRVSWRWSVVGAQVAVVALGVLVGLVCVASMSSLLEINRIITEVL